MFKRLRLTAPPDIQLYAVQRGDPLPAEVMRAALGSLPPADRERILGYRRWEDALRGLLAARMCRYLLAKRLNRSESTLEIRRGVLGRPFLAEPSGWPGDFNLSHSGGWIVCALSDQGRVGVDVEQMEAGNRGIATGCFTPEEWAAVARRDPEQQGALFYRLWTLKEAYLKAIGTGLTLPLTEVGFSPDGVMEGRIELMDGHGTVVPDWGFEVYQLDRSHVVAICANRQRLPEYIEVLLRDEVLP